MDHPLPLAGGTEMVVGQLFRAKLELREEDQLPVIKKRTGIKRGRGPERLYP